MTIVYPRALPGCEFTSFNLDIEWFGSANQLQGGHTQFAAFAWPRWRLIQARTIAFQHTRADHRLARRKWSAWLSSMRGGAQSFYCYDVRKPYPYHYPGGVGLTDGIGNGSSVTAYSLTVSSIMSGMKLEPGDMMGLIQGGNYSLHRMTESRTASGSTFSGLAVEPQINTSLFTFPTVNFIKPVCIMTIEPGSVNNPDGIDNPPISFRAIQKVI